MSHTEQIMDRFTERQGWSQATQLDLTLRYIDQQESPEAFEDFLTGIAETENEWDPERDDQEEPLCDRHGGRWGEDETCSRCCYDNGMARPLDDKGPLGPGAES